MGNPEIGWSFGRENELKRELLEQRDKRMGVSSKYFQMSRKDLVKLAQPQVGSQLLAGKFMNKNTPRIDGVFDIEEVESK